MVYDVCIYMVCIYGIWCVCMYRYGVCVVYVCIYMVCFWHVYSVCSVCDVYKWCAYVCVHVCVATSSDLGISIFT